MCAYLNCHTHNLQTKLYLFNFFFDLQKERTVPRNKLLGIVGMQFPCKALGMRDSISETTSVASP